MPHEYPTRFFYDKDKRIFVNTSKNTLLQSALKMLHMNGACKTDLGEACEAKMIIAKYLCFKDPDDMYSNYENIDKPKLAQLAGPHGWVVYKAWLAKQ